MYVCIQRDILVYSMHILYVSYVRTVINTGLLAGNDRTGLDGTNDN